MDKTKSGKEEINKSSEQKQLEKLNLPVALAYVKDLQSLLDRIDYSREEALKTITKDAKSIFTNKKTLLYITNLVNLSHEMAKIGLTSAFSIDFLNMRLDLLDQAILSLYAKTKKLPSAKGQRNVDKEQKELDEIIEKMELQKKKETVETFEKIDKIRRDLLRDAIV